MISAPLMMAPHGAGSPRDPSLDGVIGALVQNRADSGDGGVSKCFLQQLSRFTFEGGSSSLGRWPSLHRYQGQKKSNPYLVFGVLGIARPWIVFVLRRGVRRDDCSIAATAVRLARFMIPIGIVFSRAISTFF